MARNRFIFAGMNTTNGNNSLWLCITVDSRRLIAFLCGPVSSPTLAIAQSKVNSLFLWPFSCLDSDPQPSTSDALEAQPKVSTLFLWLSSRYESEHLRFYSDLHYNFRRFGTACKHSRAFISLSCSPLPVVVGAWFIIRRRKFLGEAAKAIESNGQALLPRLSRSM